MSITTRQEAKPAIATVLRGSKPKRGTIPASPQDTTAPRAKKPCRLPIDATAASVLGHGNAIATGTQALVDLAAAATSTITPAVPQDRTA